MSKSQKPMVGTRIPQAWMEQIQEICDESGRSSSEILREALAEYLKRTDAESVKSINKRLAALERQYQKLVKLI